jgi:hypothetical protein
LRVEAEHADRPAIWQAQARNALDGCRLARAVRPDDAEDLLLADRE